ncbi:uncharacterized protein LOC112539026 [Tetranychus urticae]|uniref:Odorant receptor n=1 Tax=Tetranychus urticae TaxID=32264 RepID=T1KI15_TETUR|nr:uncharacterized protein LOC112539026 [Tetranychus urticae]
MVLTNFEQNSSNLYKKLSSNERSGRAQLAAQITAQSAYQPAYQSKYNPYSSDQVKKPSWLKSKVKNWPEKLSKWVESHATDSQLIYLLNYMEQQSKSRLIVINGYNQKENRSLNKFKMAANFFLCFLNFVIVIRFGVLAWLQDDEMRGILGDCFIGFFGKEILNATTCIAFFVFASIKLSMAYQEFKAPITYLCFFNKLRNIKFRGNKLLLDPQNETKFRKLILVLGYFIIMSTYLVWLPILMIHLFSMVTNPFFTYPLFICQCVWLIPIHISVFLSLQASWWFFFHLIVGISYATGVFNSLATFGHRVNNKIIKTNPKEIIAFFQSQQRQFNLIEEVNRQLTWGTFAGYIFGSLMSELIFFCSTYLGTGSNIVDNLLLYLGLGFFGVLIAFNLFAARTQSQIVRCGLNNYRLSTIWPSNYSIYFKASVTFERLSCNTMAFYVGQLFPMDDFHFLIFFLENASLYLLLITNISAKTGRQN